MKKSLFRTLCVFAGILLLFPVHAFSGVGDTVTTRHQHVDPGRISGSMIQRMTRVQLLTLIDQLLEADSISPSIIEEIQSYIEVREQEGYNLASAPACSTYPAEDIYPAWDQDNFFNYRENDHSSDTARMLVLASRVNGNYYHPCPGKVTSRFGWRDSAQHKGIDIDLEKGDKVAAAFDGMVRIAKRHSAYGNVVVIRHYNGLETVYAHLSKLKVKPGEVVLSGQTIGLGGSTGRSTGPHLHFEVRFKGQPVNPEYLVSFPEQKLLCDTVLVKRTRWGVAAYPAKAQWYTVSKGDNLFEIAKRFGTTAAQLAELNGLSRRSRLTAGLKLRVAGTLSP